MVRYDSDGTDRLFLNYGVLAYFGDQVYRLDGKLWYGVQYGAKLALPVQKWPQNGLSAPKPPIFAPQCAPPMCCRHTMLPWTTLRLGWGRISSGAATARAIFASEWPLRPNTSHFHLPHAPLMCWRHTMLPWATLGLGWGCISLGEGPGSGLRGNSKSDAVLGSCSIVCDLFINNCWTKKMYMGRNWSQMAKLRSKLYCTVAPSLYGWDRTFQTDRTSTVLNGANTVQTV